MNFSIVITTYNRLRLLKRAIASALSQTIPCEVVIADDCSDDGTREYVQSLGQQVVYHRNLTNLGHSQTVNAGVEVAKGNWIKLLDDDDYLTPNCLEEISAAIASYPRAVICSCQALQVNEGGEEIGRTKLRGVGKTLCVPQEDIHYGMLMEVLPFGTPVQVAFSKEAFIRSGGWDSHLDGNCDDIDSWIKIARYGDAIFLNKYLAYRTVWSGSCNQKFSLQKRLATNFLMKQRIHALVAPKYQNYLPELELVERCLKLHWFLVGLKHKKPLLAFRTVGKDLFSPRAWLLLLRRLYQRKFIRPPQFLRKKSKVAKNDFVRVSH